MNIDNDRWLANLSQVALAIFGGLIGTLMRKEASTWQTALLGACGAGFVGLLVAKLCHAGGVSEDLTFVFVGVSGWLGAQRTIDYLEQLIESKLGLKIKNGSITSNCKEVLNIATEGAPDADMSKKENDSKSE